MEDLLVKTMDAYRVRQITRDEALRNLALIKLMARREHTRILSEIDAFGRQVL
jgi:hypothetical protein